MTEDPMPTDPHPDTDAVERTLREAAARLPDAVDDDAPPSLDTARRRATRRRSGLAVAAAVLVAVAIATALPRDDGGPGKVRTQEPTTSTIADLTGTLGGSGLTGAGVAVVGDEVWLAGGTVGDGEVRDVLQRRSIDGTIIATTPLPDLADHEVVRGLQGTTLPDGSTYFLGTVCVEPPDDEAPLGGCDAITYRAEGDRLVRFDGLPEWAPTGDDDPFTGYGPVVVGTLGDRIVVNDVTADGPVPGYSEAFTTAAADLETGASTPLTIPAGALTVRSVCAEGQRVVTTIPRLRDDLHLVATDVWVQDGDAPAEKLGSVSFPSAPLAFGGGAACGDGFAVLYAHAYEGLGVVAVVDTTTGEQLGPVADFDSSGPIEVPPGGDGSVVVWGSPGDIDQTGQVFEGGRPGAYYLATPAGLTRVNHDFRGPVSQTVAVDGTLYDLSPWLARPDEDVAPTPLS